MIVVGVTGGVGTGKSTVAKMLGELGAVVIDADRVAHEVIAPRRAAWRAIVKAFGRRVLNDDQTVNRARLAAHVFRSPAARERLNAIVHPRVIRAIHQQLRRLARTRRRRVVVLDVPLLMEVGMQSMVDALVVVTAPPDVQRRRLRQRGYTAAQVAQRTNAQWALSAKVGLADVVVDNSDGLGQTRRQVRGLWKQLLGITRRGIKRTSRGSIWPR